jgi:hypothetical protein
MPRHQSLELGNELDVPAEAEIGLDSLLDYGDVKLF